MYNTLVMKSSFLYELVWWVNSLVAANAKLFPHNGEHTSDHGVDPRYWTYDEAKVYYDLLNQNTGLCKLRDWFWAMADGRQLPYYNSRFYI